MNRYGDTFDEPAAENTVPRFVAAHLTEDDLAAYHDDVITHEVTRLRATMHLERCLFCQRRLTFLQEVTAEAAVMSSLEAVAEINEFMQSLPDIAAQKLHVALRLSEAGELEIAYPMGVAQRLRAWCHDAIETGKRWLPEQLEQIARTLIGAEIRYFFLGRPKITPADRPVIERLVLRLVEQYPTERLLFPAVWAAFCARPWGLSLSRVGSRPTRFASGRTPTTRTHLALPVIAALVSSLRTRELSPAQVYDFVLTHSRRAGLPEAEARHWAEIVAQHAVVDGV